MAGKGVTIDLLGNSSSIRGEIAKTRAAINSLDATVKSSSATQVAQTEKVAKSQSYAAKQSEEFRGRIAAVGGAYLGVEAIFKAYDYAKEAAKSAEEAAAANVALEKAIRNVGITNEKTTALIGRQVVNISHQHGFLKDEVERAYAVMLTATGSQSKAFTGLNVAMDLARARGLSLQQANLLVAKAEEGVVTGLKRLGIEVPHVTSQSDFLKKSLKDQELALKAVTEASAKHSKGTIDLTDAQKQLLPLGKLGLENLINDTKAREDAAKAADKQSTKEAALATLQQKFGGQKNVFDSSPAGAAAKAAVASDDVKRTIGQVFLPALGDADRGFANFVFGLESNKGVQRTFANLRQQSAQLAPELAQATQAASRVWSQWGPAIENDTRSIFAGVGSATKSFATVFTDQLAGIGDLAVGDWHGALGKFGHETETALLAGPRAVQAMGKVFGVDLGSAGLHGITAFSKAFESFPSAVEKETERALNVTDSFIVEMATAGASAGSAFVDSAAHALASLPGAVEHAIGAALPGGNSGIQNATKKLTGKTPGGATGMYIGGRYGADDVHVRVTGDEAIINPRQRAMIDRGGYSVLGALRATGAPTIQRGGGYAGGAIPVDVQLEQKIHALQALLTSEQKHLDPLSLQITQKDDAAKSGRDHLAPSKQKELRASQEHAIKGFEADRDRLKVRLQRRETAQRQQLSDMQQRFSILTSSAPGAAAFNTSIHPLEAAYAKAQQRGTSTAGPLANLTKAYQTRIRFLNSALKGNHSKVVNDQIQQELTSDYGQLQSYQQSGSATFDASSLVFLSAQHQYQLDKALQLDANGNPVDPVTARAILSTELANMQRGEAIATASGNYAVADSIVQQESQVASQLASLNAPPQVSQDTQAQLAQSQAQVTALTRGAGFQAAFDSAFGQGGLHLISVLGDGRSAAAVASVATKGFNAQPFIASNAGSLVV